MSELDFPLDVVEEAERPRWRDTSRLVWQLAWARPWPVIALSAFTVVGNARVGVYLLAEAAQVEALFTNDGRQALVWALAWIAANAVEELYWALRPWMIAIVNDHAVHRFQKQVMERSAAVPLVAFEQGPFYALFQRASDDLGGKLSRLLVSLVDNLQVFVMGASIAFTLWIVSPWLTPILLLAAVPAEFMQLRVADAIQKAMKRHATGSQLLNRIEHIVRDRNAGAGRLRRGSLRLRRTGRRADCRRAADTALDLRRSRGQQTRPSGSPGNVD